MKEIESLEMIRSMRLDIGNRDIDSMLIVEEITGSRYVLEHDLTKFINRHLAYRDIPYNGVSGLLKKMDMDCDGLIDIQDLRCFIIGTDNLPYKEKA